MITAKSAGGAASKARVAAVKAKGPSGLNTNINNPTRTVTTAGGQVLKAGTPEAMSYGQSDAATAAGPGVPALDTPPVAPDASTPTTGTPPPPVNPQQTGELSYDQAKQNLVSGGLTGGALNAAQGALANKYGQAHTTLQNSGIPAPQTRGEAMGAVSGAIPGQQDTSAVDQYISEDPAVNTLMSSITDLLNPPKQASTLMQDYKKLYKDSGLDEINEELIDADTVINGTEDDIRNEIQTAGGFGTESQVQAMALSRNKGLLKRYNQLVQMKTDATNQLNTLSSLNAQDKQMAQSRLDSQINNMFKLADFKQQSQNNIREQAQWLTTTMGADGVYAAYKNDPRQLQFLEKTLGLAPGGLSALATQAATDRSLDNRYKQAQINKINADISGAGSNMSPEDLIAYAQQYASTGQIPTGLPKGSFGLVSSYAKEMPKVDGEIVDNGTNIKSSKLTATQIDAYASGKDLINKLGEAQTLFDKTPHGFVTGSLGNVFPTQNQNAYTTVRGEIVDLLGRLRSGAVINADEEQKYLDKVPNTFNQSFFIGQSGESKLEGLKKSLTEKLDTGLKANGVSMYGFSTVKLGGTDYKVGDIITSNGVSGRVLPDGSIVIISQ